MGKKVQKQVVLVHGYPSDEQRQVLVGMGLPHITECYMEGGYTLHLATSFEVDGQADADTYINALYENEDNIPDARPDEDSPVFTGTQPEPIEILNDELETSFLFIGGMHGYDEDGELYEN